MSTSSSTDSLRSEPPPPPGPGDHRRGPEGAPPVLVYADFECPFCAALEQRLAATPVLVTFRHFPVKAKHPRARAAAHAAEAAHEQGAFWPMHDALFADQGRLEDPHLWERARALGLDLDRFVADARSAAVADRVQRQFRAGLRAGVATTPTVFLPDGTRVSGRPDESVWERLRAPRRRRARPGS